jgi:hypothetical protein
MKQGYRQTNFATLVEDCDMQWCTSSHDGKDTYSKNVAMKEPYNNMF